MKRKTKLLAPLLALGVAGCTSTPLPPDSSDAHPANAHAAPGALPPLVPMLMNATNLVMVKPVIAPAPEHPHGHGQHEMKPQPQGAK